MIVAKEYQPSIIYIDECEKVWPAKKKGKKKKRRRLILQILLELRRRLSSGKLSSLMILQGSLSLGALVNLYGGSKKDFKKFFDKSIYFPFPDYTTRRLMWKTFID